MAFRKKHLKSVTPHWRGLFEQPHRKSFFRSLDGVILGVTIVLALGGLIAVFSASGYTATERYDSPMTLFVLRQFLWLIMGVFLLLFLARLDYAAIRPYIPRILVGCMVLLAMVLLIGAESHGARRWLALPWFSVQPGELSKLVIVLYLASYLAKPDTRITTWQDGLFQPLLVVGVLCMLLVFEDFGTPVVLGTVLVCMLFLAGARMLHLSGIVCAVIPPAAWLVMSSPERWERLTSFLHPEVDPMGAGHQLRQSFLAFNNGGVFGQGLGAGGQKLGYLPEAHTDFVLSLIGEELGFIGTIGFLGLFVVLILKGFRVAAQAPDMFGRYLALGITLLIGVQVLMNAGVVSGLLPTKGLTLPLVSYGGSSLVTSLMAIGLLLSVARQREGRV
ncbi:MAG: putative lipid II flippase FtsW [Nitrospirales bacterium]|nr:putative lipid II flippase FtsW [Nitrospira sp.]MDR4500466.1 putative lipid II flippase FtsW [Nitrospirales bacterium]